MSALTAAAATPQLAATPGAAAPAAAVDGGEAAATSVATVADVPVDFRALIANLTLVELPVADAGVLSDAAMPAIEDPPALESDIADQQPEADTDSVACTDLQAAIAAMSTLPWPVSTRPVSLPEAGDNTVAERGTHRTPAALNAAAVAMVAAATGDAARSSARSQSQTSTATAVPSTATEAVPLALLSPGGQLSDSDSGSNRDSTPTGSGQRNGADAPAGQAIAELRASFSAVVGANTISARVERAVAVPVHDARWPAALAGEVRWCAQAGVQSATLKVVPDHLGPVELTVDMKDNKVNVSFTASQPETRSALEESLPRLRELLASSGLTLGQANVQQEARRESHLAALAPRFTDDSADAAELPMRRISIGLVDEYA